MELFSNAINAVANFFRAIPIEEPPVKPSPEIFNPNINLAAVPMERKGIHKFKDSVNNMHGNAKARTYENGSTSFPNVDTYQPLDGRRSNTLTPAQMEAFKAGEKINASVLVVAKNIDSLDTADVNEAQMMREAALTKGTIVVEYDPETASPQELLDAINFAIKEAGYESADNIAFANHARAGMFNLFADQEVSVDALQENDGKNLMAAFWRGIGEMTSEKGRIDLLGCNLAGSSSGMQLIDDLEEITGRNVAASTDVTGNDKLSGNWILETDGVDVSDIYFDQCKLSKWYATLYLPLPDDLENHMTVPALVEPTPSDFYYDLPTLQHIHYYAALLDNTLKELYNDLIWGTEDIRARLIDRELEIAQDFADLMLLNSSRTEALCLYQDVYAPVYRDRLPAAPTSEFITDFTADVANPHDTTIQLHATDIDTQTYPDVEFVITGMPTAGDLYQSDGVTPILTPGTVVTGDTVILRTTGTVMSSFEFDTQKTINYTIDGIPNSLTANSNEPGTIVTMTLDQTILPNEVLAYPQTITSFEEYPTVIDLNGIYSGGATGDFVISTLPFNNDGISLPNGLGTLYQYDAAAPDHIGTAITIPGTVVTDPQNRVIFVPSDGNSGIDYARFEFQVKDAADTVISTAAQVELNFQSLSGIPLAISSTQTLFSGEEAVFNLGGMNHYGRDNDYYITQLPTQGKIYQYLPETPTVYGAEITAPNTVITDADGRFIYVPDNDFPTSIEYSMIAPSEGAPIYAPTEGTLSLEFVPPQTTPLPTQDITVPLYVNTSRVIRLDAETDSTETDIDFTIRSLPSNGKLYQMDGTEITSINTIITDELNRVVFLPDADYVVPDPTDPASFPSFQYDVIVESLPSTTEEVKLQVLPLYTTAPQITLPVLPWSGSELIRIFFGNQSVITDITEEDGTYYLENKFLDGGDYNIDKTFAWNSAGTMVAVEDVPTEHLTPVGMEFEAFPSYIAITADELARLEKSIEMATYATHNVLASFSSHPFAAQIAQLPGGSTSTPSLIALLHAKETPARFNGLFEDENSILQTMRDSHKKFHNTRYSNEISNINKESLNPDLIPIPPEATIIDRAFLNQIFQAAVQMSYVQQIPGGVSNALLSSISYKIRQQLDNDDTDTVTINGYTMSKKEGSALVGLIQRMNYSKVQKILL